MKKNYIILTILLICTVVITLLASNLYKSRSAEVSPFYKYMNKITSKELDTYMLENSDAILYISDKSDLSYVEFEKNFQLIIEEKNLKAKSLYIDKGELNKKLLKDLKNNYNVDIEISDLPIVVIIIDKKAIKIVSVDNLADANTFIDYGVFE